MAAGQVDIAALQSAIGDFSDPETGRIAASLSQIRDLKVEGDRASLTLALTTHSAPIWNETRDKLIELIKSRLPQLKDVQVNLAVHERPALKIGNIGLTAKSVIAVGSGKGGVGKSTIATVLALGGRPGILRVCADARQRRGRDQGRL